MCNMDPTMYLPKEVWCCILFDSYDNQKCRFVLSSTDFLSLSQVSPFFDYFLKSERTSYLFQKVFPLIRTKLRSCEIPEYRCVSKRWKTALDNFYTNHASLKPYNHNEHGYLTTTPHYSIPDDEYHVIIYGARGIHQKLASIQNLKFNANSIRGNKIQFVFQHGMQNLLTENELCMQYFDSIRMILERIGRLVFYVDIVIVGVHINCTTFYTGMQRCFNLLPNLRSIMIDVRHVEYDTTDEKYVPNLITANPLPDLPHFKVFDFRIYGMPLALKNYIFNCYRNTIQKLAIMPLYQFDADAHLQHLSELVLYRVNDTQYMLNTLHEMAQHGIRLQKFVSNTTVGCDILDVLNALRQFEIREIRLKRIDFNSGSLEESGDDFEPIESLCTLEIEDSPYISYQFLSKLPNLEFLYLLRRIEYEETDYPYEPHVRYESNMYLHDCLYFCIPPPASFWAKYPSLRELYMLDNDMEFSRRLNLKYRFPRQMV